MDNNNNHYYINNTFIVFLLLLLTITIVESNPLDKSVCQMNMKTKEPSFKSFHLLTIHNQV